MPLVDRKGETFVRVCLRPDFCRAKCNKELSKIGCLYTTTGLSQQDVNLVKHLVQVSEIRAMSSREKELQELTKLKTAGHTKQTLQPQRMITIHKSITKPKIPTTIESKGQIQRRDIPFQQQFVDHSSKLENLQALKPESIPTSQYPFISKVSALKPLGKLNETEAERAERIHKSFERLLTFVEIVGQVDNYVSSKWKNLVRTVSNFYEVEDEPYRVSAKRIYGTCQNAL